MTTLARPYALAAFETALEKKQLAEWEGFLNTAAAVAIDPRVQAVLASHQQTKEQLATVFCDILRSCLTDDRENFIRLLAEYNRLSLLPDIAALFKEHRAEYEQVLNVQVTSAVVLDKVYQQKFSNALTARLKRKVALHCDVDQALLGGAIVRAGDIVIDGSTRGKLHRLLESFN